jgi:hypothetical protein
MHHDILDVIRNIQDLYENNSSLAVLKDFERVFEEMDVYVYKNWLDGELAYGPRVDRHWITAGFMWEADKMPDPVAGKRLMELGCKVLYQKSHLLEPRKIKSPDDIRPGTKKGKLDRKPIWIVEVQMPKKIAFDIYKGYMDKMKNDNSEGPTESTDIPAMAAPQAVQAPSIPGAAPATPSVGGTTTTVPAPGAPV